MTRLTCTVLTVLALAGCTTRPSPPPVDINSVLGQTLPPSPARQRLESLNEDIAECAREADRGAGLDRYAMARSRQCMELRGHRTTSPVPALVRPAGADGCKVSGRECPEGVPSLKDFRGWPDAWQLAWVNGALSNESDLECARDATASEIVDAMRAGQDLDPQKPALYAYLKTTARRARCTFTKPARRVR
jgi:hypothetical protein